MNTMIFTKQDLLKSLASVGTVGSIPSVIRRPRVREGRASRVSGLLEKCVQVSTCSVTVHVLMWKS